SMTQQRVLLGGDSWAATGGAAAERRRNAKNPRNCRQPMSRMDTSRRASHQGEFVTYIDALVLKDVLDAANPVEPEIAARHRGKSQRSLPQIVAGRHSIAAHGEP